MRDASTRLSHRGTKSVRGQYFDLKLLLTTIDRHIMTGSTLGERQIIRILTRRFATSQPSLPLGFDDDVAVFPISRNRWIVLKTDMLFGHTDVPPGMSLEQAARKAVVATVSDFAAKGVQPLGLLISLGLTPPVGPRIVNEIAKGLNRAAREYDCRILGGDTGESDDLVIDCIGFGLAEPKRMLRRSGARPGDVIAVTGTFGKTAAGLRILLAKNKASAMRFSKLVESVTHPMARLETGLKLARSGAVHSSIDSSDGLAWSLHEIARLSRVDIFLENIPVAPEAEVFARRESLVAEDLALYGGEEYELVVAIRRDAFSDLKKRIPSLIRIGRVEAGRGEVRVLSKGRIQRIEPRGWEHMVSMSPYSRNHLLSSRAH